MTYSIDVQNDANYPVDQSRLSGGAETVLAAQGVLAGSSLTIVITDNAAVQALNQQFRDIDAPTDVLSFPADAPPIDLPDTAAYLGDLVIAYPYALSQARHEGHNAGDSLVLLVIHGTLHLLGYDHDTLERRAAMWVEQESALKMLGISPEIVPALENRHGGV
jgi:probable rRNA maturation factor